MCVLKVIEFWCCLYIHNLGLKLYIFISWLFTNFKSQANETGKQAAFWNTADTTFLPSVKQKGRMTRELLGWIIMGEKNKFAWFVVWELAWTEAAEVYLNAISFCILAYAKNQTGPTFSDGTSLHGKGLCFESVTFYRNIMLSAILLMQHGTLSVTDLGSFLSVPMLASRQPAERLVQLFDGVFQGPTTSCLPDMETLISAQYSYHPEVAGDSWLL